MIKSVAKNSVLVLMLFGLFTLPYWASAFIEYDKPQSDVLGVQTKKTVVVAPNQKQEERVTTEKSKPMVEKRVDLELNLTKDKLQRFYDVLPGVELGDSSEVVVVVPIEFEDRGIDVVKTYRNGKVDLIVKVPDDFKGGTLPVTLLIIE